MIQNSSEVVENGHADRLTDGRDGPVMCFTCMQICKNAFKGEFLLEDACNWLDGVGNFFLGGYLITLKNGWDLFDPLWNPPELWEGWMMSCYILEDRVHIFALMYCFSYLLQFYDIGVQFFCSRGNECVPHWQIFRPGRLVLWRPEAVNKYRSELLSNCRLVRFVRIFSGLLQLFSEAVPIVSPCVLILVPSILDSLTKSEPSSDQFDGWILVRWIRRSLKFVTFNFIPKIRPPYLVVSTVDSSMLLAKLSLRLLAIADLERVWILCWVFCAAATQTHQFPFGNFCFVCTFQGDHSTLYISDMLTQSSASDL